MRHEAMLALLGALALGSCAPSAELQQASEARATRALADALEGRVAGEPVDCVNTNDLRDPRVIDSGTILYNRVGRTIWRNDLASRCPALRPTSTIIVEIRGGTICRGEPFRVAESGSSIPAVCAFGRFTPYRRAEGAPTG